MRLIFHLFLLTFFIIHGDSSLFSQIKNSLSNFLKHTNYETFKYEDPKERNLKLERKDPSLEEDNPSKRYHKNVRKEPLIRESIRAKRFKKERNDDDERKKKYPLDRAPRMRRAKKVVQRFRMDPVLNFIARRTRNPRRNGDLFSSSMSSSSSLEMAEWKDEWKEHWITKKIEAIKSQGQPRGDVVNMVAARPWGVPCGDPDQHDMPWGSCMMAMECDPEYRIFRGDYFCGRTQFVCCAIQLSNYDMYQGFDVSFADSGLSTDSDEKKARGKNSRERRRRKRIRDRKKRRKQRMKRKRKIKRNIRKIVREMRKILNRSYRNGTTARKKKTKQLKKFIKDLKKKYKSDRKVVASIHDTDILKIDQALLKRLDQIRGVNKNFLSNSTFREIVMNGTMTKKAARMLVEAYPELADQLNDKTHWTRRSGGKDYLDYDIEYGMLYY